HSVPIHRDRQRDRPFEAGATQRSASGVEGAKSCGAAFFSGGRKMVAGTRFCARAAVIRWLPPLWTPAMSLQLSICPPPRNHIDASPFSATVSDVSMDMGVATRGEIEVELELRHAGPRLVTLRYERVGDPALPVLFVAGGISADRHVAASERYRESGWW